MAMVTVESVVSWMILAAIAGLVTNTLYNRGKLDSTTAIIIPILVFYISFVLTITVLERAAFPYPQYELEPFWSYKAIRSGTKKLIAENFWNVILFIPIGGMAALLCRNKWTSVLYGAGISVIIEVTQLITRRGLFEFDDIIHNTVGAIIGVALFLLLSRWLRASSERMKEEDAEKDGSVREDGDQT